MSGLVLSFGMIPSMNRSNCYIRVSVSKRESLGLCRLFSCRNWSSVCLTRLSLQGTLFKVQSFQSAIFSKRLLFKVRSTQVSSSSFLYLFCIAKTQAENGKIVFDSNVHSLPLLENKSIILQSVKFSVNNSQIVTVVQYCNRGKHRPESNVRK